jgi:hypothetical protein
LRRLLLWRLLLWRLLGVGYGIAATSATSPLAVDELYPGLL